MPLIPIVGTWMCGKNRSSTCELKVVSKKEMNTFPSFSFRKKTVRFAFLSVWYSVEVSVA